MAFDATVPSRSQTYGDALASTASNLVALNQQQTDHAADDLAHNLSPLRQSRTDFISHTADTEAHGLTAQKARITALEQETTAARGSTSTLDTRLSTALMPSGAIRLSSLASKWITPGDVPTMVNPTTFTVPTDRRLVFIAGALLRFTVSGAYVYGAVASSSFSAGVTTVVLDPAYSVLTSGLSGVDLALIAFDNNLASSVATLNANLTLLTSQVNALMVEQIEGSVAGKPAASQVLIRFIAIRAFSLPIALAGSQAKAGTASTASAVINLAKNGTNFATVIFAVGNTAPTLAAATATSFAAGDVLTVAAPVSQDATLADLALYFKGVLQ